MKNFKFNKEDLDIPIYKVSQIKIKDNSTIKSWEITNESLILRIPLYWYDDYSECKMIMEYQIPFKDLREALKED